MSMTVEDIVDDTQNLNHSRLEVARSLVMSGTNMLPGKHAVLIYARSPWVLVPLTSDRDILDTNIANITPVMDNGGSDMKSVFWLLTSLYGQTKNPIRVILLSDGGDTGTSDFPLLPEGVRLQIVGLGTESGWPISLGYDALGQRRYKIYQGKELSVGYEKKNIEKLAKTYDAPVSTIENIGQIPSALRTFIPSTEIQKPESFLSPFRIIGSLFIFLALIFPPYVSLRKN